jgi:hypothetical protein
MGDVIPGNTGEGSWIDLAKGSDRLFFCKNSTQSVLQSTRPFASSSYSI